MPEIGQTVSHFVIREKLGAGGPAFVRGQLRARELRRGLAVAQRATRP